MAVKLGKKHRIIGSAVGPKGDSVGRIVIPTHPITDQPPHSLWGVMYVCRPTDNEPFTIKQFGKLKIMDHCVCAEDWLEEIDDPDEVNTNETKEELEA